VGEAGKAIGRSKATAGNYLKELEDAGKVHRNGNGWQAS
jgi:predicted transcriptional regulator